MTPATCSTQNKRGENSPDTRFAARIATEFAMVIVAGLLIARLLEFTLVALTE